MGYSIVKLNSQTPPPTLPNYGDVATYPSTLKNITGGWLNYGKNNLFPQEIIDLNNQSAVNKAIIENKVTYICGNGVKDDIDYHSKPNPNEVWDIVIEKLARDYTTFGGFCFQVILNEDETSVSIYHTDFSKVRIGETNDYGVAQTYYLSNNWLKTSQYPPTLIKAHGSEKPKKGEVYLFYYRDYEPNLEYYPIPSYYAAISYIQADGMLGKFYRNTIDNGFIPSALIYIPGNPSPEEKEAFNKDMNNTYIGSNGANKLVTIYGESQEVRPEVMPFNASTNADVYNTTNDIIFQKIISAHSLTSPTLAGISGSGSLSGNANEIINSFILYNATVIKKLRRKIIDALNPFVVNNGYNKLEIVELSIAKDIKGETEQEVKEEVNVIPNSTQTV